MTESMLSFKIFAWIRTPKSKTARQLKEEQFILAINSLRTLQVTTRGGMSIDPEEIRDKVIQEREKLKYLVRRAGH